MFQVNIPPKMRGQVDKLAKRLRTNKATLIRVGLSRVLSTPPKRDEIDEQQLKVGRPKE